MPFKTPSFWYKSVSWQALALTPLAALYALGHKINVHLQKPYKSSVRVICVGNVVMGGSGKTPTVLALLEHIKKQDLAQNPIILTRGYGGSITQATRVDPFKHTYHDVGDEALLLAQHAQVIVSANRKDGAQKAELLGADLIVMDDGFQNNTLHKDINLLVVDGANPFGNGFIFPAGPLREPKQCALKRCDAVISINGQAIFDKECFTATIKPESSQLDKNKNYVAFAGLGRPKKFKTTLEELGVQISSWHPFADHHPYTSADLERLDAQAVKHDSTLITTSKDHVRLPDPYQHTTQALPITLFFNDDKAMMNFLEDRLASC
jgi:tetraacyldisaccharide 4'-kinase